MFESLPNEFYDLLRTDADTNVGWAQMCMEVTDKLLREHPSPALMPTLVVRSVSMKGEVPETKEGLNIENAIFSLDMDFNTQEEKANGWHTVANCLIEAKQFPLLVGLASEAWMVRRKTKEEFDELKRKGIQPRDCEDREEIVQVNTLDVFQDHKFHTFAPITRDDERCMVVGKWEKLRRTTDANLLHMFFVTYAKLFTNLHDI